MPADSAQCWSNIGVFVWGRWDSLSAKLSAQRNSRLFNVPLIFICYFDARHVKICWFHCPRVCSPILLQIELACEFLYSMATCVIERSRIARGRSEQGYATSFTPCSFISGCRPFCWLLGKGCALCIVLLFLYILLLTCMLVVRLVVSCWMPCYLHFVVIALDLCSECTGVSAIFCEENCVDC